MLNKLNALQSLLLSLKYDIICITETWLGDKILDSVIIGNAPYSIVRSDRNSRRGGGSCIIIANYLYFKVVCNSNLYEANIVCIDLIEAHTTKFVRIINVYCPPSFKNTKNCTNYTDFIDYLSELSASDSSLIILGDFNAPKIQWNSTQTDTNHTPNSHENTLIDFAHQHKLTQLVNFPTRGVHILDLLFTNNEENINSLTKLFRFGTYKTSDHDSFSFAININTCTTQQNSSKQQQPAYRFDRADYSLLNHHFMSIDWVGTFAGCVASIPNQLYDPLSHLNALYDTFCHIICDAIEKYVPVQPNNNATAHLLPQHIKSLYDYRIKLWNDRNRNIKKFNRCTEKINKEISKFMKYKERKNLAKTKTKFDYVRAFIKSKQKRIPTLNFNNRTFYTDIEKSNSFAETFQTIFNHASLCTNDISHKIITEKIDQLVIYPYEVHKYLKSLCSKVNVSPDHIPEIFLKRCANSLCYPLTYIFQFISMTALIPDSWKRSVIVPIPKVPNSSNPMDYRPISLLCPTSKVFEKILFTELTKFFTRNDLIPKCQHGFQSKKSVTTSLIETFEDLSIAHEKAHSTDIIYFDLSKAFDSVPINRLITKLNSYGISGAILKLISNYLSNRSYSVKVGQIFSNQKQIPSGVPQGSVCGPLLFISYIADLPKVCNVEGVTIKLFADDLKIYRSSKNPDSISTPLQEFIDKFSAYCSTNGLSVNSKKCEVLHLGNKNKNHTYSLLGNHIKTVDKNQCVRDLGLHFTSNLTWERHIDIISKKSRRVSFAILKSIKFSDMEIMLNLYKIYVRPILEFATNIFNPYLIKDINKLEKIQKVFLEIMFKRFNPNIFKQNPFAPLPPYNELLFIFHLESLELRRLKSDLSLFHKHLHGNVKINCYNSYTFQESITRGEKYKIIPNNCKTMIRHNAFFVRTSRLYSKLPVEMRNCDVKSFKHQLDCTDCLNKFLKCKI